MRSTVGMPAMAPSVHHALAACMASVVRCEANTVLLADPQGGTFDAEVSTHLPPLQSGQAVLVAVDPSGKLKPLVTAAWPVVGAASSVPWLFDAGTGELSIQANRVNLEAGALTLQSGEAQLRLTVDGTVELRGDQITSAAVETHRIEGGSIEFN